MSRNLHKVRIDSVPKKKFLARSLNTNRHSLPILQVKYNILKITKHLNVDNQTTNNVNAINNVDVNNIDPPNPELINFDNHPTNDVELIDIINELANKNSVGFDNISTLTIKRTKTNIVKPLTHIANLILSTGVYPNNLKISKVIILHKSGPNNLCKNYRPIALLTILNKIFENLIYRRLLLFVENNKLLSNTQYGFRKRSSTDFAIIDFTEFVKKAIDKGDYVAGVFLDEAKAFDSINHELLIDKLSMLGIKGINL